MIDRSERKWVWIFAVLVMTATTLPYFLGYVRQGVEWRYTGLLFAAEDVNSYFAKMLTGSAGAWLFRTPFSAYPQQGVLLFVPYLLLGKLAGAPELHPQLVALFHLFRWAGGVLAIAATYDFTAVFIAEVRWRRLGTALATLGSGLGWLSVFGLAGLWKDTVPLEFYSPETFGFLMFYGLPHLAWARAFLLWGMRDYLMRTANARDWREWLRTGLLWIGLGLMQPITVVIGWAVIGTHLGITGVRQFLQKRRGMWVEWEPWRGYFINALRIGALSAPLVLYTFISFKVDPFLKTWENQSYILSPPFHHYLLAYGMLLPLAVLGMRSLLQSPSWQGWLVMGWVVIFPLLAYAPFSSQRRLLEGVWVSMAILAMKWLECSSPLVRRWAARWVGVAFLSTAFLYLGGLIGVWTPVRPLYLPAGEVAAFQFLEQQARPGAVVLAAYETSNALPAWAPVRTVTGHGPESMNGPEMLRQVTCFYDAACPEGQRLEILRVHAVNYVIWGPQEQELGGWDPHQAGYLRPVYQNGPYTVFQFEPSS